MTPPSAPYQAFQQAERVAALEAETRAERQYTGAQLVELSTRIGAFKQENKELFDKMDARMGNFEGRLSNIEMQIATFINQGKGIGRVAAVIWPVIAGIVTAILYQFIGLKL